MANIEIHYLCLLSALHCVYCWANHCMQIDTILQGVESLQTESKWPTTSCDLQSSQTSSTTSQWGRLAHNTSTWAESAYRTSESAELTLATYKAAEQSHIASTYACHTQQPICWVPHSTTCISRRQLYNLNWVPRDMQIMAPLSRYKWGWIGRRHAWYLFPLQLYFTTRFLYIKVFNSNCTGNTTPLWRILHISESICVLDQRTLYNTLHIYIVWCVSLGMMKQCLKKFSLLLNQSISS